jgi:hypothetical protein
VNRLFAIAGLLILSLLGLTLSTELVAGALHHAPALGPPWATFGGTPLYPPWAWIGWSARYRQCPRRDVLREDDEDRSAQLRLADQDEPIGMLALLERDGQFVKEDGHRLLKRDAVLPNVRASLRVVPRGERPVVERHAADAKGVLEILVRSGAEPVKRNAEIADAELSHHKPPTCAAS